MRPESQWTSRVKSLLADYPEVPLAAMGFPADWQSLALWKNPDAEKAEGTDSGEADPSKPEPANGDSSSAPTEK